MIRLSNCKINIGLDIVARRHDGYHDIVTSMVPVPWHDIIEIIPSQSSESSLFVLGNKVDCPPEKNLAMKAYYAMRDRFDLSPVDIILEKIIPDGAGLGGGSADAATVILTLNDLFDLKQSKEALAEIAATIGADCPFFIYNRPMLATGTGTILRPIDLDLSAYTVVIAKPQGVNISTKQAYAGVKPMAPVTPLQELLSLPINQWQGRIKNDFEASIFPLAPQIAKVKEDMLACDAAYSSMSGSGASVYGLFTEAKSAESCAKLLSDCTVWVGKI